MKSILRKAADQGLVAGDITVTEGAERELVLLLDAFDGALARNLSQAGAEPAGRPCVQAGPGVFQVLRRLSGADRRRRGGESLAAGPGDGDLEAA
ncbi:MAG: hypothetical protein WDN06_09855 [Asticcacaulis sp.]